MKSPLAIAVVGIFIAMAGSIGSSTPAPAQGAAPPGNCRCPIGTCGRFGSPWAARGCNWCKASNCVGTQGNKPKNTAKKKRKQ